MHRVQHVGLACSVVTQQQFTWAHSSISTSSWFLKSSNWRRVTMLTGTDADSVTLAIFAVRKVGDSPRMPRPGFPPRIPELIKRTNTRTSSHGQTTPPVNIEELTGKTEQFIEDNSRNLIIAIAAVAVIIVSVVGYGKFIVEPTETAANEDTGAPSSTS